jgi:hypothetical protein
MRIEKTGIGWKEGKEAAECPMRRYGDNRSVPPSRQYGRRSAVWWVNKQRHRMLFNSVCSSFSVYQVYL